MFTTRLQNSLVMMPSLLFFCVLLVCHRKRTASSWYPAASLALLSTPRESQDGIHDGSASEQRRLSCLIGDGRCLPRSKWSYQRTWKSPQLLVLWRWWGMKEEATKASPLKSTVISTVSRALLFVCMQTCLRSLQRGLKTSMGFAEELEDMLVAGASTSKRFMTAVVWTTGLKSPSFVITAPQDRDSKSPTSLLLLKETFCWAVCESARSKHRKCGTKDNSRRQWIPCWLKLLN